jgi:hypothetical protein
MLCLLGVKIMPGEVGCQGFVCFFSQALTIYKSINYETFSNNPFNYLVKKITLL